jgi:hypothetical protein
LCSGDEFARKLILLGVFQSPEVDNPWLNLKKKSLVIKETVWI